MNRYTNTPGGILINATGILVAPMLMNEGKPATWKDAKELAAACRYGDHTDWRLPTVEEAFHIADRSRFDPALDPEHFQFLIDAEIRWLWTSTEDASVPAAYAWYVLLSGGYCDLSGQRGRGLVVAVRGPVASPGQ